MVGLRKDLPLHSFGTACENRSQAPAVFDSGKELHALPPLKSRSNVAGYPQVAFAPSGKWMTLLDSDGGYSLHELLDELPQRPVTSGESPQVIRQLLGADSLPERGSSAHSLLAEAADLLFDHSLPL
jgi:hypothetical protein